MNPRKLMRAGACACAMLFACALQAQAPTPTAAVPGVSIRLAGSGLNNPRGLEVAPGSMIDWRQVFVAEGGTGGTSSTAGRCAQVLPPIGPYTGSVTGGRISHVVSGVGVSQPQRTTVTTNLPTSQTSVESGSLVSGVADVAFMDHQLYALIAGGGCSHGLLGRDNAVVRISRFGSVSLVANLSQWIRNNPGQTLASDFEPDGAWYSMVAFNGGLYLIEPNHGLFLRVNATTGAISRILDVATALGTHAVPTALARHKGYFYIGNLGTFPIVDGTQRVWRVLSDPPRLQMVARGTAIVGLAFDPVTDAMYILQLTSGAPGPTPGMGSILRVRPGGAPQTIVRGLSFPTALTIGRYGELYVTNWGFGAPLGSGQVYRISGLR